MNRAEIKLNRRGFSKIVLFGLSAVAAGVVAGCGVQDTEDNEPTPLPIGDGQTSEGQDLSEGSSSREDGGSGDEGSSSRDEGSGSR